MTSESNLQNVAIYCWVLLQILGFFIYFICLGPWCSLFFLMLKFPIFDVWHLFYHQPLTWFHQCLCMINLPRAPGPIQISALSWRDPSLFPWEMKCRNQRLCFGGTFPLKMGVFILGGKPSSLGMSLFLFSTASCSTWIFHPHIILSSILAVKSNTLTHLWTCSNVSNVGNIVEDQRYPFISHTILKVLFLET